MHPQTLSFADEVADFESVRSAFCSKSGTSNTSSERRAIPEASNARARAGAISAAADGRLRYQAKSAQLSDEVQWLRVANGRLKEQMRSSCSSFAHQNSKKTD
jgi:hypothetical protein